MNQQQAVIKTFAKDTTRGNDTITQPFEFILTLSLFNLDEDPREALLKYADLAESDPLWVSNGSFVNQLIFILRY